MRWNVAGPQVGATRIRAGAPTTDPAPEVQRSSVEVSAPIGGTRRWVDPGRWEGPQLRRSAGTLRLKASRCLREAKRARFDGLEALARTLEDEVALRRRLAAQTFVSGRGLGVTPEPWLVAFADYLEGHEVARTGRGLALAKEKLDATARNLAAAEEGELSFHGGLMNRYRGYEEYRAWFGPTFEAALLDPQLVLVDSGTGAGQLLHELRARGRARETSELIGIDLDPLERQGLRDAQILKANARELPNLESKGGPLRGRVTLILDHHAAFSYAPRPDELIYAYLAALRPGGLLCLTLSPRTVLAAPAGEGSVTDLLGWITKIRGFEVVDRIPAPGSDHVAGIVLRRTEEPADVPRLRPLIYTNESPPWRLLATHGVTEPRDPANAPGLGGEAPREPLLSYAQNVTATRQRWASWSLYDGRAEDGRWQRAIAELHIETAELAYLAADARDRAEPRLAEQLWRQSMALGALARAREEAWTATRSSDGRELRGLETATRR